MKTLLSLLSILVLTQAAYATSPEEVKTVVCDVDARWDNGNRPIEDGSIVANMLLESLNKRGQKIEFTVSGDVSAHSFKLEQGEGSTVQTVKGFAASTSFIDDQHTGAAVLKFRGSVVYKVLNRPQMVFVKGYFTGCK
jgi:hypothetical protein